MPPARRHQSECTRSWHQDIDRTCEEGAPQYQENVGEDGPEHLRMVNMCCAGMEWVTHRSLHDPNFSLEKGYDAHDDLHRVPKSSVQEAGQCLPEG